MPVLGAECRWSGGVHLVSCGLLSVLGSGFGGGCVLSFLVLLMFISFKRFGFGVDRGIKVDFPSLWGWWSVDLLIVLDLH